MRRLALILPLAALGVAIVPVAAERAATGSDLATLIALIALSRPGSRNLLGAPKALGIPFVRDER